MNFPAQRRSSLRAALLCAPLLCCVAASGVPFAQAQEQATITVDPAHVENHISPRMYAAFAEMMGEDVKWGLTAEMLHDRSFEEAPNYLGLPADWQLEPDTRNDNVGAITFTADSAEAYPLKSQIDDAPQHSLRVTLAPGDITDTRRGFSQGHLSVAAGQAYNGYVWLKLPEAKAYAGPITVALEEDNTDGLTYARQTLPAPAAGTAWQQLRFTLTPDHTDRFAKLTLLFPGKGTLYLDQLSLEPASAKTQVRADAEAMIGKLHPSFLRWPGGNVAQDYHWQWGIGPRDLRPTWTNKSWSNAPEPDDLGTDEYLALCARLHIEPSITVNVGGNGATPEEAASWVEYVNGPASSHFGAMRAANGHPAPYGVKQWELGNEIFGGWVRGHVTAETYAQEAVRYAQAMRAVDPSLKLIAVGQGLFPSPEQEDAWNSAVLKIAGPDIEYLAVHDYNSLGRNAKMPHPRAAMMARAGEFEANYRHTAELIQKLSPGHPIGQIVNEWNLFYDAQTIQSMEGAVYAARMMDGFERDGDTVAANCISDLLNGWVGGVIQASRDRIYGTSQFWALEMWSDHLGTDRLRATVSSPELQPGTASVDAVVTRSADGRQMFLKLSNADLRKGVHVTLKLAAGALHGKAEAVMLSSPDPMVRNSFRSPEVLQPRTIPVRCAAACTITLPPDAVAVVSVPLR